jgi:signal peptidase I
MTVARASQIPVPERRSPVPHSRGRVRFGLRIVRISATVAFLVLWLVLLRPQTLGGPAGYEIVSGTSMLPGIEAGDIVVVRRHDDYRIGDVVSFRVPDGEVGSGAHVIHRIVGGSGTDGYVTQGDNRDFLDPWRPRNEDVVGKQWIHIPGGSRVVFFLISPLFLASLAAGIVVLLMLRRPQRR